MVDCMQVVLAVRVRVESLQTAARRGMEGEEKREKGRSPETRQREGRRDLGPSRN